MKKVYSLEIEHEDDPSLVEKTQKLSLDYSKPHLGLKGTYGLYGSPEWWENIYSGKVPSNTYEGVIEDIDFTGMHNEAKGFTLKLDSGGTYSYTCVVNRRRNMKHYQIGRRAKVTTLVEILKKGTNHEFVRQIDVENA
ncbi:hypothetical protein L4D15_23925 [Enterovibrio norvegicus]|uniref:hypothetical protein n=1 Tax=Enterovibrio norvegicus TaxID=188144 RepID=UPI003D14DADF